MVWFLKSERSGLKKFALAPLVGTAALSGRRYFGAPGFRENRHLCGHLSPGSGATAGVNFVHITVAILCFFDEKNRCTVLQ